MAMGSIKRFFYTYGVLLKDAIKTTSQLIYGVWKVSKLPHPIVTIFGGSRFAQENKYTRQAHELAHKLVERNISVITGGGPGIMQAASCGAMEVIKKNKSRARTLGITVSGLESEGINECIVDDYITTDFFFARKWLMINYSVAFAVFPGGFGTLEELSEVLTLMQTKKLASVPIVLIGSDYWKPLLDWWLGYAVKEKLIVEMEMKLLVVVDDIDQAVELLKHQCDECEKMDKKRIVK
ncbi:MAG: LOG family protein YvdD [Candidatus Dependentiae bacterium ADurb.Bin331]|nr:MAG: LOG family protein YvdD [Candidatus Dependentiae bacterium ADurb.Bin331]